MTYVLDRTADEIRRTLPNLAGKLEAIPARFRKGGTLVCQHLHLEADDGSDNPVRARVCVEHPGAVACGECAEYHLSADRRRGDECAECGRTRDEVALETAPVSLPMQTPEGRLLDLEAAATLCRLCIMRSALGVAQAAG